MLSGKKEQLWKELLSITSNQEQTWMSGYLSGALNAYPVSDVVPEQAVHLPLKITIAYGTETGNAKSLSAKLAALAKKQGTSVKLVSLEQYKTSDLHKETALFIVVSTQGDGEPPLAARKFYDYIYNPAGKLAQLQYAVLALGDSSYPLFCKTGEDIDLQLEKNGAQRFASLIKCDTDYEEEATRWFEQTVKKLDNTALLAEPVIAAPVSSGKKNQEGVVAAIVNLNDRGSAKETYHIEITTDATYQPGDSIGIIPPNTESLVNGILVLAGTDVNKEVIYKSEKYRVGALLKTKVNISHLPERVVARYAAIVQQQIPETKIGLLDLLRIYPVQDAAQFEEILGILEPIAPRLYSISSAPSLHEGELHITVSKNSYQVNGEERHGLCSEYLSLFEKGSVISFYVHANRMFRLPEPDKDIIMIGPGTGIAPFRSYLAEREATGATGRNWLFFGDQHFVSDFLYQTEIQSWHETGLLTQVNVAFSRDQQEKIYVQHKMKEQAETLYRWLEDGASLYVCGSKDPMSRDVEETLLDIVQEQGKCSREDAISYLGTLKETARYHKDVY